MKPSGTIVIAGGGTGGHLMPGLAVARALAPERPVFIGTARGLEAKLVPAAGFELRLIAIGGLMGTGWRRQTRTLARLPAAVAASARILKEVRAGVVLGIGGYASGPVLMAAGLMRVPIVLLEVNARTGMANRWAARWAKVAAVNFPETARDFRRAEITGIPVRKEFFSLPMPAPNPLPLVLVTGGSQGAHALNQAVRAMAPSASFGILHQTGTSDAAACVSAYAALGGRVSATAFLDDMPAAMAQADLVVCRAGASTLGELAAARRPAILVPFPGAADQHQLRNAEALARAGAAVLLDQRELTPERLAQECTALVAAPQRLAALRTAIADFAHPDAANRIAALVRQAAQGACRQRGGTPPSISILA